MKAKVLIVALIGILIAACSKEKYTTAPILTFKDVNGSEFATSSIIDFKMDVTDKQGDINDTIWAQQISLSCPGDTNLLMYKMPDIHTTPHFKAEVNFTFIYNNLSSNSYVPLTPLCTGRDDSTYFRFWIKDEAGHTSDTVTSPTIKLLK